MAPEGREKFEGEIRAQVERGDVKGASTAAIEGLGPELYGFLLAVCANETDASDVFSITTELLWRGLEKFRWSSSLRTWAYTLARHAAYDHLKKGKRRGRVMVGEGEVEGLSQVEQRVRSQTLSVFRTARRTAVEQLRAELPEADRQLLVLRVDRQLEWNDLARVFLEEEGEPDAATLKREAARLRKRFQLVKERLLELGRERGLFKA